MTLLEFDCQRTSFKNGKKAFDSTQEGEGGGRKPVCYVVMQGWRRGPSSHVQNIKIKKLEVSQYFEKLLEVIYELTSLALHDQIVKIVLTAINCTSFSVYQTK